MNNNEFARYVRRRAKELRMNLTTVAKRTGISRQALYNLDSGVADPNCSFLISLSGVLLVHPIELLQVIIGHRNVPAIEFAGGAPSGLPVT